MAWEAIVTLLTLFSVLAALVITRVSADLVLMAALAFLLITGILGPADALAGFANPGVITIATLYVVAAGLKETGAVQWIARLLLGHPKTEKGAQLRMLAPTGILSGFMNNTAVVAMFIPPFRTGPAPGYSILTPSLTLELRRHSGRYLHVDWYQHQPGGGWHAAGAPGY